MGYCLSITFRTVRLLVVTGVLLPFVREAARETLSRARERYRTGRDGHALVPPAARRGPAVVARRVALVPSARLVQRLVTARPMGP
jgi:hypothetical protein